MIVNNVAGQPVEFTPDEKSEPLDLSSKSWLISKDLIFMTNSKISGDEIFSVFAKFPKYDYREPESNTSGDYQKLLDILKNSGFYQLTYPNQLATVLYLVCGQIKLETTEEMQRQFRLMIGIADSDVEDIEDDQ